MHAELLSAIANPDPAVLNALCSEYIPQLEPTVGPPLWGALAKIDKAKVANYVFTGLGPGRAFANPKFGSYCLRQDAETDDIYIICWDYATKAINVYTVYAGE